MSVTFWCPQAPIQIERVRPFDDDPTFLEEVPLEPFLEINMSNINASVFLQELGYYNVELVGRWTIDDLSAIYKKLMRLLNTKNKNNLTSEDVNIPASSGKMRIIEFGRDTEYVEHRLSQLLQLVQAARSNGFEICYA